jgi:uncharacterized membrane protein HdeD (DUF308 family)
METPGLDDFKRFYHLTWWALVLRGLFALAVGLFVFLRPLESVAAFALVIAFWALFSGVVEVVHGIDLAPGTKNRWLLLLSGLIGIGFGVAALVYYPVLSLTFAVLWTAWWLICVGILGTYGSMVQKKLGVPWGWTMAFGVLSIVAAVFALAAPPATLAALMGLIGGLALAMGVALIAGAFSLRALVRRT